VREKITLLRKRLLDIEKQAFTQRKERGEFIRVALVGYTNVGKSTLMNLLSKSDVLAENKLFATLDTTTRKMVFENTPFLLSDTVGFIRKLPHHLIESFKSTLDEVKESDILMHVVDISHPQYEDQMKVVNTTLAELGCADKPTITVFNKMDLYEERNFDQWLEPEIKSTLLDELRKRWENETTGNCVFVSAVERRAIDQLRATMLAMVREVYVKRYPYRTGFQQYDYGA
jgi:GTP-binding protein HflX